MLIFSTPTLKINSAYNNSIKQIWEGVLLRPIQAVPIQCMWNTCAYYFQSLSIWQLWLHNTVLFNGQNVAWFFLVTCKLQQYSCVRQLYVVFCFHLCFSCLGPLGDRANSTRLCGKAELQPGHVASLLQRHMERHTTIRTIDLLLETMSTSLG